MKKNFLLRIDEEIFDEIKDISEIEERSINYMMCKLINKGLNCINLSEDIEKEIEKYANKTNKNKTELMEDMWRIFKKTYAKK